MAERFYDRLADELRRLAATGDLRRLADARHDGRWMVEAGRRMVNLSSNDYLGLAADEALRDEFLAQSDMRKLLLSSSSSRLLTGNFRAAEALEETLAAQFGAESALTFGSGYHMNTGILPALCDRRTLILADKLVHASLIDGIRLSEARCIRYRHQDYAQLEMLLERHAGAYAQVVVVTESVFSMDGDVAPLDRLVALKRRYDNLLLYVDEAHGIGVRGACGLGVAEEQGCLDGIDLLCGTFGKALASMGAYVVCRRVVRDYLVNRMRPLIFSTALPPLNLAWTRFVVERLPEFAGRRERLDVVSRRLREAFRQRGLTMPSQSHIVPMIVGTSEAAVLRAEAMRRKGFYVLPVRPPTVPEGSARLRFSLTAALTDEEVERLIANI